jgi:hypothetical protein
VNNTPSVTTGPIPASILQIQGDPTKWGLRDDGPEDHDWTIPVPLQIIAPVTGTLVLSPTRVGSLSLVPPLPGDGWMPAFTLIAPHLYIPTPTGMTAGSPGYLLAPPDNNLATLQQNIINAMSGDGSSLTVHINVYGGGVVVLDGAQLPFAVLGQAT